MTHRDRAGDPPGRREAAGDAGHRQGFPTPAGGSPARPERRFPKAFGRRRAWLAMPCIATPSAPGRKPWEAVSMGHYQRSLVLIAEPGVGVPVFGEVFELDDRGLEVLDVIEGTDVPNGYRRISIAVEDAGSGGGGGGAPFDAWTYVKDRAAIEGIHSEPMAEYARDPRYVLPSKRTTEF